MVSLTSTSIVIRKMHVHVHVAVEWIDRVRVGVRFTACTGIHPLNRKYFWLMYIDRIRVRCFWYRLVSALAL
jgi:hypothetical protein